ncbi:MAG TPA: antibiotic biosynthesis monooxygenase family protein, partial [Burkholderiales bacterium]|nr:antibiotic biosynthesis monooxygenase family protein [Burkholderiales bacterium]
MAFRNSIALVVPAVLCLAALDAAAQAPDAGTMYVVTYVELKPTASADAATLLKAYRDALRQGDGNLRAEVLRHTSRPGQFVVLSAWKDQKAFEAQRDAARNKELRERLQALRNSPADDRIHVALS